MKKIIYFLSFILLSIVSFAQSPQAFKYQSVIRNNSGDILANQIIGLQISIIKGENPGTTVYTETWNVETNQFGLVSLEIGTGTAQYGTFSGIDWGTGTSWLKVALDETGGTNYVDMGTSQLLSVPYALYSNSSASSQNQWSVNGSDIYYNDGNVGIGTTTPSKKLVIRAENKTDTLLEIQDMNGNPLMIITPTLTKFNIYQSAKGVAGGFAVGRYTGAKGIQDSSFLLVTPDSTRIYTGGTGKGVSGGFAVGRYTGAKGTPVTKYFYTNIDSTRIYTDGTGKGVSGGFAVGRYTGAKSISDTYMHMTSDNYFIGHGSGLATTTGIYNLFFGYQSGYKNRTGERNTFLGHYSGYNNIWGDNNIYIGDSVGFHTMNAHDNIFIGNSSGYNTEADDYLYGSQNVFVGNFSGYKNMEGFYNVYIGQTAGHENVNGYANVFVGGRSGEANLSSDNTLVGGASLYKNTTGRGNTSLGAYSGTNNLTGSKNVFIGYQAGYNETGSNRLYIESGGSSNDNTNSLIYGEFDNDYLRINGVLDVEGSDEGNLYFSDGLISGNNVSSVGGIGVLGKVNSLDPTGTGDRIGVSGVAWYGQSKNYGLYGYGYGGTTSYGIFTTAGGATTNWAAYFDGNVNVTGTLSKGAGSFKIDHPLDPENKYLYHSFVESPDMMNIYNGNIVLNKNGEAVVILPDWFEALNMEFRYQLTAIGSPGPNLYVKEKIKGNKFIIAGGAPGTEVSWQVTGIRHDAFANKNRIKVEVEKNKNEKGKYLYPDAFDKPKDMGIDYEKYRK